MYYGSDETTSFNAGTSFGVFFCSKKRPTGLVSSVLFLHLLLHSLRFENPKHIYILGEAFSIRIAKGDTDRQTEE